ncbi:MAG: hypothetical protein U5K32_12910 [Bacteroidales bacterium]|nr:hypothetical protein [Bacteroidales bacterium]
MDNSVIMEGWIKLHRKLLVSDMYQALDTGQRDVLITCLLLANHEAKEWEWNETIFKVNPGQFITSLASLRKHCASDVSIQNIRTALLKLEKWQFLTNKSTKTGRLITILNWDTYQNINYEANKDTGKELTKNQQLTRMINNDKEFIYADFEDF